MTNDIFIYFLFIVNAYILGLLPLEHLAIKLFPDSKKNNSIVSFQEFTIFLLSFLKGFIAVLLPSMFGVPLQIQALCGISSIVGHSWSPFFDFKEGKGFPVLLGALLPLYFSLVLIMLLVCIIFSLLWTVPVAVMISVLLGVTMSFASVDLWNAFLLIMFTLFVLIIKRLFPLKDIFPFEGKKELIENRLFFDQDDVPLFKKRRRELEKQQEQMSKEVGILNAKAIKKTKTSKSVKRKTTKTSSLKKKPTERKGRAVATKKEEIKNKKKKIDKKKPKAKKAAIRKKLEK